MISGAVDCPPSGPMQDAIKSALGSLDTESLLVEAMQDMVKDEIKAYMRQKIDENPELKAEIKEAVRDLIRGAIESERWNVIRRWFSPS